MKPKWGGALLLPLTAKFKLEKAQPDLAEKCQTGCYTSNHPALNWEEKSPVTGHTPPPAARAVPTALLPSIAGGKISFTRRRCTDKWVWGGRAAGFGGCPPWDTRCPQQHWQGEARRG